MKKQLLFVVSIVLTATLYAQNIPSYVPTNGLVGWWPFNGNANDESGNGNHGTVHGATLNSDRNGAGNKAYNFNGNNDRIVIENSLLSSQPTSYSISIWFLSNSVTGELICDRNTINYDFKYRLVYDNDSIIYATVSGEQVGWNKTDYPKNKWNHVVAIGDLQSNTSKFYLNGVLIYTRDIYYPNHLNATTIGANYAPGYPGYDNAINGKIDDIAIYNRALTQQEITALYLGCSKPSVAITPKSTTNIKENESVVLAATKGNGYSYSWYKDGVVIANATDSNYTATLPGVYTVKVTSAACDSTSAGVTVKRVYALPNYLPTNGLVGWWPFNGNANDESGNENHGTVNGATLTSDRNGEVNKAYSFDGINDFISIDLINSNNTKNDISISCWYKAISLNNSDQQLVFFGDSQSARDPFSISINTNNQYSFRRDVSTGTTITEVNSNIINLNHQYQHLLGSYNSSTGKMKIYINGYCVDSTLNYSKIEYEVNGMKLNFGALEDGRAHLLIGNLDDIAIYNRALTQEEITALYLGEACTTPIATITPQSATSFCSGGSVNINAATNANYTYKWLNNGAAISAATTATYKATTSGKYSVIVKNNSGCIDTSSVVTVNVSATPSLPILTGPATLCYNSKAIFKASIAGGTWGVANDYLLISSPQGLFRNNKMPPSNLYKTGVTYTLKSKDKLCSVTAQKSVWIRNVAATSVTLTASKQTLKVGEEVAATATTKITGNALFWMSASTSFVSVTGVSPYIALIKGLRPATGANITFSVDDAAKGCRNAAFLPFTVTAAASLVDNESNTTTYTTDLNVYPNPSNGMVTIENIGDAKTISLIDVTGRVLKTTAVNADRMRLDYSTITKGNYFISIQGENLKEMKSIVIE